MAIQSCLSLCLAETVNPDLLQFAYPSKRHKDTLHLAHPGGDCFLFDYGVLVSWGLDEAALEALLATLKPALDRPLARPPRDKISFETATGKLQISNDHLLLPQQDLLTKLACSHALAQSVKLETYEEQVQATIDGTSHIPETLAREGRVRLGRRQLARIRGSLHLARARVNLHYELLDKPDFFWDYPELEPAYGLLRENQELDSRLAILDKRQAVLGELLDILADEQQHNHSAVLEWVIIWLIAIEIIIFVVHDLIGWPGR
ncbi:RMD1 family protein [Gallaecimonas sp. GXIMD4217]|uniref:RMD1 family protein n=1 Tax=Gallaecimonas sp. GXIMD4217 TaxID=3131927 RepID=UPI00311B2AC3